MRTAAERGLRSAGALGTMHCLRPRKILSIRGEIPVRLRGGLAFGGMLEPWHCLRPIRSRQRCQRAERTVEILVRTVRLHGGLPAAAAFVGANARFDRLCASSRPASRPPLALSAAHQQPQSSRKGCEWAERTVGPPRGAGMLHGGRTGLGCLGLQVGGSCQDPTGHHCIFLLYHFHTFLYTRAPSTLNPKPQTLNPSALQFCKP